MYYIYTHYRKKDSPQKKTIVSTTLSPVWSSCKPSRAVIYSQST